MPQHTNHCEYRSPPRSVRTGFLKHLSNGDDVVSLISFSTPDSSSEALFDVLPQKNGGLTLDQNLSDFFWGWYWPTSCQNSSNAPCNIFLAIKSLAMKKKNPCSFPFDGERQWDDPTNASFISILSVQRDKYKEPWWKLEGNLPFVTSFYVLQLMHLRICYCVPVLLINWLRVSFRVSLDLARQLFLLAMCQGCTWFSSV